MAKNSSDLIQDIFKDLSTEKTFRRESDPKESVTFWLSREDKAKFDMFQDKTNREFGRRLKILLSTAIQTFEEKAG